MIKAFAQRSSSSILIQTRSHAQKLCVLSERHKTDYSKADPPDCASFLRTVSMTWPLRAALVINSSTCLWDLPLTGTPSMQSSSSPARRRPSFSAAPSGTMAPMYTCVGRRIWVADLHRRKIDTLETLCLPACCLLIKNFSSLTFYFKYW